MHFLFILSLFSGVILFSATKVNAFGLDPEAWYFQETVIEGHPFFVHNQVAKNELIQIFQNHTTVMISNTNAYVRYYRQHYPNIEQLIQETDRRPEAYSMVQRSFNQIRLRLYADEYSFYYQWHTIHRLPGVEAMYVSPLQMTLFALTANYSEVSADDLKFRAALRGADLIVRLNHSTLRLNHLFDQFIESYTQSQTNQMVANIRAEEQREAHRRAVEGLQAEHNQIQMGNQLDSMRRANTENAANSRARIRVTDAQAEQLAYDATLNRRQAEAALEREAIVARIRTTGETIRGSLSDPKVIAGLGSMASLYFLSKYGIPLLLKGKPNIVTETSLPENLLQRILGKKKQASRLNDLMYNPKLHKALIDVILNNQKIIQNHELLSNLLFYGPPGTGKTLAAKEIARHSGAHYIVMSGSDLIQLSTEEALQELKKLFLFAHSSRTPVIVFIDEADALFPHRKTASEMNRQLTNLFLTLVEKPSDEKLQFIFASNLPGDLDPAILSRVSKSGIFHFDPPNIDTRVKLLEIYLNKFIALSQGSLRLSSELLSDLAKIANLMQNWVGRDIEQLVLDVLNKMKSINRSDVSIDDFLTILEQIQSHEISTHD